jgi:hypothetical protein
MRVGKNQDALEATTNNLFPSFWTPWLQNPKFRTASDMGSAYLRSGAV